MEQKGMLEMHLTEMYLGDGMKEVVVVTSPRDQQIFHDARHFYLEVTEGGEVNLVTEDE